MSKWPPGKSRSRDIAGDKDIDVHAGRISIASTRAWDYRSVDLSVDIGAVKAPAYGADKGGFFPSFRKKTVDGEYGLHAHVITGEIDLLGSQRAPKQPTNPLRSHSGVQLSRCSRIAQSLASGGAGEVHAGPSTARKIDLFACGCAKPGCAVAAGLRVSR